jgi:uncharacterized membrane protein YphA (DoxX/SURF4 family)
MKLPGKSAIVIALRWLLGFVFIWAALGKMVDPQNFLVNLFDYRLPLPDSILRFTAVTLPWIELVCGLSLLTGFWPESTLGVILMLMAVFLIATAQAWVRGLEIDCGCFGSTIEKNSFAGSVQFAFFRNLVLIAISAYLFFDVTAENTTIASESLSGEITGKTYEAKKIHP